MTAVSLEMSDEPQKPPFRNAKRGFLEDKKGGFATQKYGCCNVLSIRRLCKRVVFAKH